MDILNIIEEVLIRNNVERSDRNEILEEIKDNLKFVDDECYWDE